MRINALVSASVVTMVCACGPQAQYEQAERQHEQRKEDRQKQLQQQMKTEEAAGLEPSKLLGGEWVCVTVGGDAAGGKQAPTLTFGDDGRVTGFGGVNRFSGPFTSARGTVHFGALAATKMAGDPPRMALEKRLFDALSKADGFSVQAGMLRLKQGDQVLAEFSH